MHFQIDWIRILTATIFTLEVVDYGHQNLCRALISKKYEIVSIF